MDQLHFELNCVLSQCQTGWPRNTARNASIFAAGQCERLASVRFLTRSPSR